MVFNKCRWRDLDEEFIEKLQEITDDGQYDDLSGSHDCVWATVGKCNGEDVTDEGVIR